MVKSAAARLYSTPSNRYRITKPTSAFTKRRGRSLDNSAEKRTAYIAKGYQRYLPSPRSSDFNYRKRKRDDQQDGQDDTMVYEPKTKKSMRDTAYNKPDDQHSSFTEQKDLVGHWLENDFEWSSVLGKITTPMDNRRAGRASKRSLSRSNSYRQSTLSGDTPRAWCGKHGAAMLDSGIFMDRQEGVTITEDDEQLCKKIVEAQYQLPEEWRFQEENFSKILELVQFKNESRVVRDLGPHIMPSPELLRAQGHLGLENIAEGVGAQWSKCTSLCGPKSTPDASHGISHFLFTPAEREKLTANDTCTCETLMFPFYVCEAKCIDKSIEESELQALHSASVASNTVIQLYEKIKAEKELDRRILAFSVSHNQRFVKIFGHFASINDNRKITYHRYRLFETDLKEDVSNRTRPYQIALRIWQHFFPLHLTRVRDALARQPDRAIESFTAQVELDDSGSGTSTTVSTPQGDSQAVVKLQEEISGLLNNLREQQEEHRREQERQREEHRQERERQREDHRQEREEYRWQQEESRRRQEKLEDRLAQQQDELLALIKQSRQ